MKLEAIEDNTAGWGAHKIYFVHETLRVYIDSGIAMYYSGHGFHSRNDTSFRFTAQLMQDDCLYISVTQTEQGSTLHTQTRAYKSDDDGHTWQSIEKEALPTTGTTLSSLSVG